MLFFFGNASRYCVRTALRTPCSCCFWKCFSRFFFQFLDWSFWILSVQYLIYSQFKLSGFFSYAKFMGGARLFLEEFFKQKDFSVFRSKLTFWVLAEWQLWISRKISTFFLSLWLKKIDHVIFRKLVLLDFWINGVAEFLEKIKGLFVSWVNRGW